MEDGLEKRTRKMAWKVGIWKRDRNDGIGGLESRDWIGGWIGKIGKEDGWTWNSKV